MITFRITTEVTNDRRVVLTLPPEVPTGEAELVVSVDSPAPENMQPQASPAEWLEACNGPDQARYPLRGSVVRYLQPTDTAAEADWEVIR